MAKKLFFAPMLAEGGTTIDVSGTGGLTAFAFDEPTELTVTLPDGSAIIADEFGNVLDTIVEEIEEVVEEPVILE